MASRPAGGWKTWLGYGLAAAALVFSARYFGLNHSAFISALIDIAPTSLVLGSLAFALHIVINALAFASLNQAFGVSISTYTLSNVWSRTLLAKYVPGGVWHVVGRGLLLAKLGVPAGATAAVGIAEQGISLGVCGLIGIAFLWVFLDPSLLGCILFILGSVAIVIAPPRVFRLFRFSVQVSPFRKALLGYALAMIPYTLGYLMIVSPQATARFVASLFAGTIIGVLALPVPGGLGIRESTTALFAASDQPAQLLAGMLAARAVIFAMEILICGLSIVLMRARREA